MVLLIRGKSTCAICGRVIAVEDSVVGFAAFLDPTHRLWRYSDAAMHGPCYEAWPERAEFEALYAAAEAQQMPSSTPARLKELWRSREHDREAQQLKDERHNHGHERVMTTVRDGGAACPHCGARATTFRDLGGTARRRLACLTCHRSFSAEDLRLG